MYQILKPNKYITIVKVPIKDIEKIEVIMAKQPKETVANCFNRLKDKPNFIVNGGLFNMSDGSTITTTVDEGQLIRDGFGNFFGLKVFKDLSFIWEVYKKGENIKDFIGCSPSLVINGKVDIRNPLDSGFMNGRHPRLAIGSNKHYFFIVSVDVRRLWAKCMSILELAKYMLSLGCDNSENLDGGGSLRLGQNVNRILKILNSPTENRAVDNFVGFYLKETKSQTENLYKITASVLNVRNSPSLLGKIVNKYSKNTIVEILEQTNEWSKTNKGWISNKYIEKVK